MCTFFPTFLAGLFVIQGVVAYLGFDFASVANFIAIDFLRFSDAWVPFFIYQSNEPGKSSNI